MRVERRVDVLPGSALARRDERASESERVRVRGEELMREEDQRR